MRVRADQTHTINPIKRVIPVNEVTFEMNFRGFESHPGFFFALHPVWRRVPAFFSVHPLTGLEKTMRGGGLRGEEVNVLGSF